MKASTIAGRLTRDGELKTVGSTPLLSLRVAWDAFQGGEKVAQFQDVNVWGKRAESLARFMVKGQQIVASGEDRAREHEGKTYWTLHADHIDLVGGKPAERTDAPPTPSGETFDGEDIPF